MSTEDAWAVEQAEKTAGAGAVSSTGVLSSAALPVDKQRVLEQDRTSWLVAAGLYIAAGLSEGATLLSHSTGLLVQPLYNSVGIDVDEGSRALVLMTCGVLLLLRRTREAASGLALGTAAVWAARYSYALRPARLSKTADGLGVSLFVAAFVLLAAGAVILLMLLIQERGRTAGRKNRQGRADRVAAVLAGFAGAVLWSISTALAWEKIGIGTGSTGISRTVSCCAWSQVDGWNQSGIVFGGAAVIVLALLAATIRAKTFATGLLFGALLLPAVDVLRVIVNCAAPKPSFYGLRQPREITIFAQITVTPTAGFWIGLTGILLLAAAAVLRLRLGPRKDRYQVPGYQAV